MSDPSATVDYLFLDLNSFFASCEQQENPALRGRPVAIVPSKTDSTCAIAASYAAKKHGIRVGTSVYDCKRLCPDITLIVARHKLYVEYHHRILAAIDKCIPIDQICSIDEVSCQLTGYERKIGRAAKLAQEIKSRLRQDVGECMTASIGIAPNKFLAKLASDMQKPDGLTILTAADLPHKILHLPITDLTGIGPNMKIRLNGAGIYSMADLYAADEKTIREIWGGIEGNRFYHMLRGQTVWRPPSETHSISHQHVLEPELRNRTGAVKFIRYLTMKAAQRLRSNGFMAARLAIQIKWKKPHGYWARECRFHPTCDSRNLLHLVDDMTRDLPNLTPFRVGAVLADFTPAGQQQFDLFETPITRAEHNSLYRAVDGINKKYGYGTIGFGEIRKGFLAFNGRIAFQRVPTIEDF